MYTLRVLSHAWRLSVEFAAVAAIAGSYLVPFSPTKLASRCQHEKRLMQGAVPGDANSPRVWNGPMAEALGLLGGWRPENTAAEEAATVSGDKCAWIASLSKKERLLEPTCLRLKEAVAEVRV